MTLPLAYRIEVQEEIESAHRYYEEQRQGLGEEILAAVNAELEGIQNNPEMFAVLHKTVRAALVQRFMYVFYFRIEPACILVMAIQHGHRSPRRWRERI